MAGCDVVSLNFSHSRSGKMVYQPIHEEGVWRFDCSAEARIAAFPTISFENPALRETPITDINQLPTYIPTFECELDIPVDDVNIVTTNNVLTVECHMSLAMKDVKCQINMANKDASKVPTDNIPAYECKKGQQIVNIKLPPNTSFYGTGEVSGPLERTGNKIVTWNTDSYGYGSENESLYQSHPWVLAVLPNGEAIGVLADTTRRCEIDLRERSNIKFISSWPYPVITFGLFASPTDVLASFSRAVGTIFMPPKWALGYHQSRWSYDSAESVLQIAKTFRGKHIPCDAIWMDIDYMDGFRCFTFDKKQFPDPKSLVGDLHHHGFKAIWMLDPGIKKENGYFVYDCGSERDIWTQAEDGTPFVGKVWPGPCVFPDFTQSKVRLWWADLVKEFIPNGVDGNGEKTMPERNVHLGDIHLGGCQKHSHYHNVYGLLMAKSTHEGMKQANEHKRPFVLTRAGFVGSQRYAATWTGDNTSSWKHLQMSIPMVLNLGLSGQPFSGPDIGGFKDNATATLFARWMGIGSMFPFCRGHSEKETEPHEPWSFGKECERVCRLALQRRYRIIPFSYTLFYLAHTRGIPVATPTFFADPTDLELRSQENSFMLGQLLIYASTEEHEKLDEMKHKLPKGIWLSFDFDDSHHDLPILYLRGGSIIPVARPHNYAAEASPTDHLTLLVALDELGNAEGHLYEDDGDGYEYTKGGYLLTTYFATRISSMVIVRVSEAKGSWKRPKRGLQVQLLLGNCEMVEAWGTDGEELQIIVPDEWELSA